MFWCEKAQKTIHVLFPHKMHRPLKVTWSSLNPLIHDFVFWLCAFFDFKLWIPLMWVWLQYFIQCIHMCLYILKWSWVIFLNLLKYMNICIFIHHLVFYWFIVMWRYKLIHKPRLYTSSNTHPLVNHCFWT
jgi:hypothetical protein